MQIRRPGTWRRFLLLQKEADPYSDDFDGFVSPDVKLDPIAMHWLRTLLANAQRRIDAGPLTDDQVLFEIDCRIASGELRFTDMRRALYTGSTPEGPKQQEGPAPGGAPVKASKYEEPDPDTFGAVNGAIQAAALAAAAAAGAPFCPH